VPPCSAGAACECVTTEDCPAGEVCGPSLICVAGTVDAGDGGNDPDAADVADTADVSDVQTDVADSIDEVDSEDVDGDEGSGSDVSDVVDADVEPDGEDADTDVSPPDVDADGDTTPEIQPIENPWIAFTSEALFDLTLPDGSNRPLEQVLSNQMMITRVGEPFALHIPTGDQIHTAPTWSPDGLRLAYLAGRVTSRSLKIVDLETAEVTTVSASLPVNPASLAWTRDGSAIILDAFPFGTTNTDVGLDLFRVAVETGDITALTETDGVSENTPRCLPDGNVYFVQTDNGRTTIARMPDDGGDVEELADDTGIGGTIGVTPDGLYAFGTVVDGADISFVRVDLTSGDITTLPDNNRGAIDVALDNSLMVGLAVLSEDQAIVPLNSFTGAITGARYSSQPEAAQHPTIDINPRPRIAAPSVAPVSGASVELDESFGGGGT